MDGYFVLTWGSFLGTILTAAGSVYLVLRNFVGGFHRIIWIHLSPQVQRGLLVRSFILISLCVVDSILILVLVTYMLVPTVSTLTYFGWFPFPNSKAHDCQVSWKQLSAVTSQTAKPDPTTFPGLGSPTLKTSDLQATANGSTALAPLFDAASLEFYQYLPQHPSIGVLHTDSLRGITAAESGTADIGLADFFLSEGQSSFPQISGYTDLDDYLIAVSPFTIIVNGGLQDAKTLNGKQTIWNLTKSEVQEMFDGQITNWHQIGGPDLPVEVYTRESGSGTRFAFEEIFGSPKTPVGIEDHTTNQLLADVASTPGAIGYTALSGISALDPVTKQRVVPVCLDGFAATSTNIADGNYPYWSFEHAYFKGTARTLREVARDFLWYVCFGDFQVDDLLNQGFLPVTQIPKAASDKRFQGQVDPNLIQDCGGKWSGETRSG